MFFQNNNIFIFLTLFFILVIGSCDSQKDENEVSQELPAPAHALVIQGDFDGDGQKETLREGFELTETKPDSIGQCAVINLENKLAILSVSGECTGLMFLQNEGDLNNDGRDELSLVRDWHTGFTRLVEIYTYRDNEWHPLDNFTIHLDFIAGQDPAFDYDTLVLPKENASGYTVMEYDPSTSPDLWNRRAGEME